MAFVFPPMVFLDNACSDSTLFSAFCYYFYKSLLTFVHLLIELEAYSNMISVFRAQGALEDNRKKLLEELRAVLHISNDRHSAEARRVSNDELLATIAEQ